MKIVKNNVINKEATRLFQSETLKGLAESILTSAGPMGSLSKIILHMAQDPNSPNRNRPIVKYTKDGHSILSYITHCDNGLLCNSVANDTYDVTAYVKKKTGDGSTGAVNMASLIFDNLIEIETETKLPPREIMKQFGQAVDLISEKIKSYAIPFTSDEAYNIAYISSNGDEEIALNIKQIYEEFGNDVFIDVDISTDEISRMKILDGMSINTGFNSPAYINNQQKGTANIQKPRIYYFRNTIDTPEQIELLASIIMNNILTPYHTRQLQNVKPTVILAPHLANDTLVELNEVIKLMNMYNSPELIANKPPLLVVTNINADEATDDIAQLCGCPIIRKYQSTEQRDKDRSEGKAPTSTTITEEWYGTADVVESDAVSTKFINPKLKFSTKGKERKRICEQNREKFVSEEDDDESVDSSEFKALVSSLEAMLKKEKNENATIDIIGRLERRIKSLKSKVVIYQVGGISVTKRDSVQDLVWDSVKNCRSAVKSGVGYGCNMEGYFACRELLERPTELDLSETNVKFIEMVFDSYRSYITKLYMFSFGIEQEDAEQLLDTNSRDSIIDIAKGYNEGDVEYSDSIKSSIDTDVVVLEAISKIVSLMMTSAQTIIPDPMLDSYTSTAETILKNRLVQNV